MIYNMLKVKVIGDVNDLRYMESESDWRCKRFTIMERESDWRC